MWIMLPFMMRWRTIEKVQIWDGHEFGINHIGFEVSLKNLNGDVRLTSPCSSWFFLLLIESYCLKQFHLTPIMCRWAERVLSSSPLEEKTESG